MGKYFSVIPRMWYFLLMTNLFWMPYTIWNKPLPGRPASQRGEARLVSVSRSFGVLRGDNGFMDEKWGDATACNPPMLQIC